MGKPLWLLTAELSIAVAIASFVALAYSFKKAYFPSGTYSILLVGCGISVIAGGLVAKHSDTSARRLWPVIGLITGGVTAFFSLALTINMLGS